MNSHWTALNTTEFSYQIWSCPIFLLKPKRADWLMCFRLLRWIFMSLFWLVCRNLTMVVWAETMYEIPCTNCPKTYIGQTGRLLKTRLNEHRTEAEKISSKSFKPSQRKTSSSEFFKSAISEHVAANNHVIVWDEARVIDLEPNKTTRWLKEAIWIRSRGRNTMNKDEGPTNLTKSMINSSQIGNLQVWWLHLIHQELPISRITTSPQSEWTRFLIGIKIYLVNLDLYTRTFLHFDHTFILPGKCIASCEPLISKIGFYVLING